jgi:hypothetical protein
MTLGCHFEDATFFIYFHPGIAGHQEMSIFIRIHGY